MRFVICGAGAVGGVVGARLHQSGHEVALIARGDHLAAIRSNGLTLETPRGRAVLPLAAAEDPAELDLDAEDVVLLATKSQDAGAALASLRSAGPPEVPIVCLQNGVENERAALRLFGDVYGAVVMTPTAHLEPGVVQAYGARLTGIIDLGRYPRGSDERCRAIADALTASQFSSRVQDDVMRLKYAKLVLNLGNAVWAMCGEGRESDELIGLARAEARAALSAAGIPFEDDGVTDIHARWERIGIEDIAGRGRAGSSTWQSLARGTGAIETDFLNGEIALLGRLHGVPTPVNAAVSEAAAQYARERRPPGELDASELLAARA